MEENFDYKCDYFITFCTLYKMEILNKDIQIALRELFEKECTKEGFGLNLINFTENAVMLQISFPPTVSGHTVVAKLKRKSVSVIRDLYPNVVSRLPNIWTKKYLIQTIGEKNLEQALDFIDNQQTRKDKIDKKSK